MKNGMRRPIAYKSGYMQSAQEFVVRSEVDRSFYEHASDRQINDYMQSLLIITRKAGFSQFPECVQSRALSKPMNARLVLAQTFPVNIQLSTQHR